MLTEEAGKEKDPNWKLILAAATIFFSHSLITDPKQNLSYCRVFPNLVETSFLVLESSILEPWPRTLSHGQVRCLEMQRQT